MEELQQELEVRQYDMFDVHFLRSGQFLTLQVTCVAHLCVRVQCIFTCVYRCLLTIILHIILFYYTFIFPTTTSAIEASTAEEASLLCMPALIR